MGRKPVGADPEEVYRTYLRTNANAGDTARAHNIPRWKVHDWTRRYGWSQRFFEDTAPIRGMAIEEAKSVLAQGIVPALSLLSNAMDQADSWKDRIFAARTYLDFYARTIPAAPGSVSLTLVDARKLEDARRMGGSDMLEAAAREILDSNIIEATEQRTAIGRSKS